jgi:DNA adenine methylase
MTEFSRSPLFYVGDKFKILNQILNYFPQKINNFYEPFVGGGSVFLNVDAKHYHLNDLDENLIKLHSFLVLNSKSQDHFFNEIKKIVKKYKLSRSFYKDIVPASLKLKFKKTYYAKFNKEGYTKLKNDFNSSQKKDFFKLYILLIYGFNRILRFNSAGKFNLPVGNVDFNKNTLKALQNYFRLITNKDYKFYNLDYKIFLNKFKFNNNDFVYCDPPYLISASEYNKFWNKDNDANLLETLDILSKKNVKWALSNVIEYRGKKNNFLINWSKKYKINKVKSNYISFNDNTIKSFKEILITNY